MSVYASVNDAVAQRRNRIRAAGSDSPDAPAPQSPLVRTAAGVSPRPAAGVAVAEPVAPPATPAPPESVPSSTIAAITKNIPTEVIGAYLAVIAIIPVQQSHLPQWVAFTFFWIITPVIVWLGVALKQGYFDIAPTDWPKWPMLASTLAFVAWAAVIPDSAISYLPWFQPYMGALAVVLLGFLLPIGEKVSKLKLKAAR